MLQHFYDKGARVKEIDIGFYALEHLFVDFQLLNPLTNYYEKPETDLPRVEKAGMIQYIQELKRQGVVRHIGLSSHTTALANRVLNMGILDMLMFSINPGYDYRKGDYGIGEVEERMLLYRRCEKEGIGISVMKAFGDGQLFPV